jgi:hypothetical protein
LTYTLTYIALGPFNKVHDQQSLKLMSDAGFDTQLTTMRRFFEIILMQMLHLLPESHQLYSHLLLMRCVRQISN